MLIGSPTLVVAMEVVLMVVLVVLQLGRFGGSYVDPQGGPHDGEASGSAHDE
jgi:hypothetical protein